MGTTSPRSHRAFFSYKEVVAGTPETTCFMEGQGTLTARPIPELMQESNKGKLGTGEHGTQREVQAIWTPFTYTCQRFSEVAFLSSYAFGGADVVVGATSPYAHETKLLAVNSRVLPTFTMEYGDGVTNSVYSHVIINEISVSLGISGTGTIECTVNGFMNGHTVSAGTFTKLPTGSMSIGTALANILDEPLIKSRACHLWKGDTADVVTSTTVDFDDHDLSGSPVDLSKLFNSISFTLSNGLNAEDMARGGGDGVINMQERGERSLTLEIGIRKDHALINSEEIGLLNTFFALDIRYNGWEIEGSAGNKQYAMKWLFPRVQFESFPEDDSTPVSQTWSLDPMQETYDGQPLQWFIRGGVDKSYNDSTEA
jgi:hypothetical protein